MTRRELVVQLITELIGDAVKAELVVERLQDEGLLQLGYGNGEVETVLHAFKDHFGTTKTSRTDRFAAHRLCQKYGGQAVAGVIKLLAERAGQPYAPVINSVTELENKWISVLSFLRKGQHDIDTIEL